MTTTTAHPTNSDTGALSLVSLGPWLGAQLGILIKGPDVLESTRRVDTVVPDKTGTVTTGQMSLTAVHGVVEAGRCWSGGPRCSPSGASP